MKKKIGKMFKMGASAPDFPAIPGAVPGAGIKMDGHIQIHAVRVAGTHNPGQHIGLACPGFTCTIIYLMPQLPKLCNYGILYLSGFRGFPEWPDDRDRSPGL